MTNVPRVPSIPRDNRWPFWLGLIAFLTGPAVGVFVGLTRPGQNQDTENTTASGINLGPLSVLFAIVGLVLAIRLFRQGRRSTMVISGLALSALTLCYFVYIAVGEFSAS